ncbi:PH domain-containing protein [Actinomycetospora chiangmaiensis]|uniref:PH domain-containing protein n=1 Tax=Actinomycetospora chiangmaiensis TaxID=402650 RepID=UPI00036D226F|nr:PH domain-containing protein [Actinomycetospora chiangmaiensis]
MTTGPDDGWRRLDPRTVLAAAVLALGGCLAAGVPVLLGQRGRDTFPFTVGLVGTGVVLLVVAATIVEYVRLARTRFRVGPERVELHTGVLVRARQGLTRDRVRTVEVSADPVLRVLGLATVRIGTGQHASTTGRPLELRALRRPEAEALRHDLLERTRVGVLSGTPVGNAPEAPIPRDATLAVLDPGWIRFAPLSAVTPALGVAAFGSLLQGSDWLGLQQTVLDDTAALALALGAVISLVVGLVVVAVAGTVASLAVFVESWWGYRLTRESRTGALHVRRGLFTRRSTTLEEDRLRGVTVVESAVARLVGAARVDAVATGLSHGKRQRSDPRALLPVAPAAVVDRVVAEVLQEPAAPTTQVDLLAHPRTARTRRVRRASAVCLVPAVVTAALALAGADGLWFTAAVLAVLGLGAGVGLGRLAYRNLGHGVVGRYVVTRHGVPGRRTVALRRDGILTWTLTRTPFQRRAGLVTLWFTTAAGDGAYGVYDLGVEQAMALAAETLGEQFTPYLDDARTAAAPERSSVAQKGGSAVA